MHNTENHILNQQRQPTSLEVQQHLTEARRDRAEQQRHEQEHERDRRPNIDLTL